IGNEVSRVIRHSRIRAGQSSAQAWVIKALEQRMDVGSSREQLKALREFIDELYIARKLLPAIRTGGASALDHWVDGEKGPGVSLDPPALVSASDTTEGAA